eukprot:1969937-Prymnesium_polylepis.1
MLSVPIVYDIDVPDEWYEWLAVFNWVNLDIFDFFHSECLASVSDQLHLTGLASIAIVFAMLALGAVYALATQQANARPL